MAPDADKIDDHVETRPPEISFRARQPPVPDEKLPRQDVQATWIGMKMILNASQHMFACRQTLTDNGDKKYDELIKNIFVKTQKEHETRHWLGTSADLWADYASCLEEVVVQVQELYQLPRGNDPQEETFTTLVINNAFRTLKDFQRTNDLILVARNMLVNCPDAQRYAVETTCHHEILNIVQICIEFNSEGFAGEAGSVHEQTFGRVINSAKGLLVTCLQFLFNLIRAGTELRTRIWLELLCLDTEFCLSAQDDEREGSNDATRSFKLDSELETGDFHRAARDFLGYFTTETSAQTMRDLLADFRNNSLLQLHVAKLYKIGLIPPDDALRASIKKEGLIVREARGRIQAAKRGLIVPLGTEFCEMIIDEDETNTGTKEDFDRFSKSWYPAEQDFTYQSGLPASPYNLSEIPIILAPSGEIEALPMLIIPCIFASGDISTQSERETLEQSIRCHFLVRSTTGRMLLRELFIFVAAWDLPEDELYYKSMINIANALHQHNLLHDAYNALADPKDIVSPGQNVLVKLTLYIFKRVSDPIEAYENRNIVLQNLDVTTVRFLISVFREDILPRALALIWLQGKFQDDIAVPEDFARANLNLWDVERTYEGVYQFLEFFSAMNDNPIWKSHCLNMELGWDIVELIRYLHLYIPIQPFIIPPPPQQSASQTSSDSRGPPPQRATSSTGGRTPSLERPYSPAISNRSAPSHTGGGDTSSTHAQADSLPPSTPTQQQPPHTYPWRNLKKMSILVLSGLLYNTPSLRAKMRQYDGVLLIASCSEHDENNPYIKEHAVLCLKLLLEGDRENQRLVEDLRAREVRSTPGLEQLGYTAGLDEAGRVRLRKIQDDEDEEEEDDELLPVGSDGTVVQGGQQRDVGSVTMTPTEVAHAYGARLVEVFDEETADEDETEEVLRMAGLSLTDEERQPVAANVDGEETY